VAEVEAALQQVVQVALSAVVAEVHMVVQVVHLEVEVAEGLGEALVRLAVALVGQMELAAQQSYLFTPNWRSSCTTYI